MQMTYKGFCALGGESNPMLYSKAIYLGKYFMHTAYFMRTY